MDRLYKKPFRPKYVTRLAQTMRKEPTQAESALWEYLRDRKIEDLKFKRQVPVGRFVLDFFCKEINMAIEIDGDSHRGKETYDANRDEILSSLGIKTIRIRNEDIENNIIHVLDTIRLYHNSLSRKREREAKGEGSLNYA